VVPRQADYLCLKTMLVLYLSFYLPIPLRMYAQKHSPLLKICKRETHEYQALIRQTLTKQNFRKREKTKVGICVEPCTHKGFIPPSAFTTRWMPVLCFRDYSHDLLELRIDMKPSTRDSLSFILSNTSLSLFYFYQWMIILFS